MGFLPGVLSDQRFLLLVVLDFPVWLLAMDEGKEN